MSLIFIFLALPSFLFGAIVTQNLWEFPYLFLLSAAMVVLPFFVAFKHFKMTSKDAFGLMLTLFILLLIPKLAYDIFSPFSAEESIYLDGFGFEAFLASITLLALLACVCFYGATFFTLFTIATRLERKEIELKLKAKPIFNALFIFALVIFLSFWVFFAQFFLDDFSFVQDSFIAMLLIFPLIYIAAFVVSKFVLRLSNLGVLASVPIAILLVYALLYSLSPDHVTGTWEPSHPNDLSGSSFAITVFVIIFIICTVVVAQILLSIVWDCIAPRFSGNKMAKSRIRNKKR